MIYLIDYENVNEAGLDGIADLYQNDTLLIFYNETLKLSIDVHKMLESSNCKKDYIRINKSGKNYLDFQLSTYLGYLISQDKNAQFRIISKDQGFDAVVSFWRERDVIIGRSINLTKKPVDHIRAEVNDAIKNSQLGFDVNVNELADMIMYYKTKKHLNNAIQKIYGSEKTGKINSAIKPLIKDKKGQ